MLGAVGRHGPKEPSPREFPSGISSVLRPSPFEIHRAVPDHKQFSSVSLGYLSNYSRTKLRNKHRTWRTILFRRFCQLSLDVSAIYLSRFGTRKRSIVPFLLKSSSFRFPRYIWISNYSPMTNLCRKWLCFVDFIFSLLFST